MADNSNPRNKQATLFKRLTRLFSGPIVNYNKQQIKRLKSTSIGNYTFTTSTGKEFKKKEYYGKSRLSFEKYILKCDVHTYYTL